MPRPRAVFLSLILLGLGLAGLARATKLAVPNVAGIWDLQGTGTFEARCDIPGFPNEPAEPAEPIEFSLRFTQDGNRLSGTFDISGAPPGVELPPILVTGTVGDGGAIDVRVVIDGRPLYSLTGTATGSQLSLRIGLATPIDPRCTFGGPLRGTIRQGDAVPLPSPTPEATPTPRPSPSPTPTPTPRPTPTPIPIPLPTIDPRVAHPQVTLVGIAIPDTRAEVCTEQTPAGVVQRTVNGPPGLTRTVLFCRSVENEVAQTVNALVNRTDTTVQQDSATGVTTLTIGERRFTFWPLGAAQEVRTGLTRAQGTPNVAVDPASGTATITSAGGIQIRVMGVPPNLQEFLQSLAAAGVTGAQASAGQFLLTTGNAGLQFSTRLNFEVARGVGATPGFAPNPDGSATITYTGGDRQQVFPLFADQAGFLDAVRALGAQVTPSLDGTVSVTSGGQTIRARPDFSVVGGSPDGSKRILLGEPGGPTFDLGDGRRQRFTIVP